MATKNQRVDARLLHLFSGRSNKCDPTTLAHQVEYKGLERKLNIRVDEYVIKIAQALLDLLAANLPPPSFAAMIGASTVQLPPVDLDSRQAEVIRLLYNPQLHSIGARLACSARTAGVPLHKGQTTLDKVFCVSTHTGR
jgi:hypothetical protein